jgi:diketogulonate reductase-like aldo/keto reductase
MTETSLLIEGSRVPRFLYGTAWKEDETQRLAELALEQGFRGIDTANQRRHYHEAGVGQGIVTAINAGLVTREDLFLQTKFTFQRGQDHRLPYDPADPIEKQVEQSFASSLEHLGTSWIDSYLLHGPTRSTGLTTEDWAAWRAMESLHDRGQVRMLGISNVTLEQLRFLCADTRIRPTFVQNRCYAAQGWDRHVREFCQDEGLVYQGFSLLTANRKVLAGPDVAGIAIRYGCTIPQLVFRFALQVGMIPLTGTTSAEHMRGDLQVFHFELAAEDVASMEILAVP